MVLTVLTCFFLPVIIPDSLVCPLQKQNRLLFLQIQPAYVQVERGHPIKKDTFYGPLSVCINGIWLHHFS